MWPCFTSVIMARQRIWGPGTHGLSVFWFFLNQSMFDALPGPPRLIYFVPFPFMENFWKLFRVINKFSEVLMLHKRIVVLFHMFFPGTGTEVIHTLSSPLSFGNQLWRPLICASSCHRSQLLKSWTSPWQCVERKDSPMTQQIYRYRYMYNYFNLVMIDICIVPQN